MVYTRCPRCGYQWNYKGRLMRRTCPNCGYNWIVRRTSRKRRRWR